MEIYTMVKDETIPDAGSLRSQTESYKRLNPFKQWLQNYN